MFDLARFTALQRRYRTAVEAVDRFDERLREAHDDGHEGQQPGCERCAPLIAGQREAQAMAAAAESAIAAMLPRWMVATAKALACVWNAAGDALWGPWPVRLLAYTVIGVATFGLSWWWLR